MEDTLNYLNENKGKHFEPRLVVILNENLPEILKIREDYSDDKSNETQIISGFKNKITPIILSDTCLTGHAEIDSDHREIVAQINLMGEAISTDNTKAYGELMASLIELVNSHIKKEELILWESKFPNFGEHCYHHRQLMYQAEEMLNEFQMAENNACIIREHFNNIVRIFLDDIMTESTKFRG